MTVESATEDVLRAFDEAVSKLKRSDYIEVMYSLIGDLEGRLEIAKEELAKKGDTK